MTDRSQDARRAASRRGWAWMAAGALLLGACGGSTAVDPGSEPPREAIAPECHEVPRLSAKVPEGTEPTGTTAEPVRDESVPETAPTAPAPEHEGPPVAVEEPPGLGPQIEQWAHQEAGDSFAGVWVDQDLGGYAVAFVTDVDRYAREVRERFHPGIAVAEADTSLAELRGIQQRITQEQMGQQADEPGAVRSTGVHVMINRTTVGVFDPDHQRLVELSHTYGPSAICFEIEQPPQPPSEGLQPLAKASGWRDGLGHEQVPYALIEAAFDRRTAARAWRENVPDDLERRDDDLPAEPGVYGDLDQVDFERQAVIVWSSGESGSCPGWLADIQTIDGVVHVSTDATAAMCTDDYRSYRMVVAVDRDRLPQPDELPHDRVEGVPDATIRSYPSGDE